MILLGLLLGASPSFAAEPGTTLADPVCWEPAEVPGLGLAVGAIGRPEGARRYGGVQVTSPRFFEHDGMIWLGDVDRLSLYDFAEDNFTTTWESDAGQGLFGFADGAMFSVQPGGAPEAGDVELLRVPLVAERPSPSPLAVPIREAVRARGWDVVTEGYRWMSPVALESAPDDPQLLYLIVEFTRSPTLLTGIFALDPDARGGIVQDAWLVEGIFDRFLVIPPPDDGPPMMVMVDNSTYLSGMPLIAGATLDSYGDRIEDVSALARATRDAGGRPAAAILSGHHGGCVRRVVLSTKEGRLGFQEDERWCPGSPTAADGGWPIERARVRELLTLRDGRVLVSHDRGRGGDPVDARLLTYLLAPPWEPGQRDRVRPLPVREATSTMGGGRGPRLSSLYEDESGRIWSTVGRSEGGQLVVQRLDLPFWPVDALVGGDAVQVGPFGQGQAVLVRAPGQPGVLLRVITRPLAIFYLGGAEGDVVAAASGGETLVALAVAEDGSGALMQWTAGRDRAVTLARFEGVPDGVVGLRVAEDAVVLQVETDAGLVDAPYRLGDDGQAAALPQRPAACRAPQRLPSAVDGAPVCEILDGEGPSWTLDRDGPALLPGPEGRWVELHAGEEGWRVGPLGLGETVHFPTGSTAGRVQAPLLLHRAPSGGLWLHLSTVAGIERVDPDGAANLLALRPETRVQREMSARCREQGRTASAVVMGWQVDGASTGWATLAPADGSDPIHLLGPVVPTLPSVRNAGRVLTPTRLLAEPVDGQPDPRIFVRAGGSTQPVRPLGAGAVFDVGWSIWPRERHPVLVSNAYGVGGLEQTVVVPSRNGIALWGVGLMVVLGLVLRIQGRRRRHQLAVQAFAHDVKIPYVAGPPVTGDMFFGRDRLVRQLLATVVEGGNYALVADDKRIGKTSLLLRLHQLLRDRSGETRCWPVYLSLERCRQGRTFFSELWRLLTPIAQEYNLADAISYPEPRDEGEAFTDLLDLLTIMNDDDVPCVVVLLLDEFQILAGDHAIPEARDAAQRLRSVTAEDCRDHLSWVAAGVASMLNPKPHDMDSDLLLVGPRYKLGTLDLEDARRLIAEPIAHLPISFTDEAIDAILTHSEGHPFAIQYTCRSLLSNAAIDLATAGELHQVFIGVAEVRAFMEHNVLGYLLERPPEDLPAYGEGPMTPRE
ncbi:MAG: hypothetical protein H6739_22520 [Alphaproteobacteria bacterium]|nr:hypothetical protein [Alphaproteobacteria bacterium]